MKKPDLVKATERVVALKVKAIDQIVNELVEPLSDVGNPEKLIRKEYSQWDADDLALMIKIYGQSEDSPLTRTIFNRTYEKVKELEAEEV